MSQTKKIEIRCEHCGEWFPSPIFMDLAQTFDLSTMEGNRVKCPRCGQKTGCNKENMRATFDDGGFTGNKT